MNEDKKLEELNPEDLEQVNGGYYVHSTEPRREIIVG